MVRTLIRMTGIVLLLGCTGYAQMTVKDSDTNVLMQVNDEGSAGSITLPSGSAPSGTTDKLYNQEGALYWNGSALGTAGSAGGWTDDGTVVRLTADTDKVGIGDATPTYTLDVSGKIGINDTQVLYLPDQTDFSGTLIVGSGGPSLIHTSGSNGQHNTAVGIGALYSNTTGAWNTACGSGALYENTTAICNTAIGWQALSKNTTGDYNTACGIRSLYNNTTGYCNVAHGYMALLSNTTGRYNTASGSGALQNNTTGRNNTAYGYSALFDNIAGNDNTAVGYNSLYNNDSGTQNTACGYWTLSYNDTGIENTGMGTMALFYNSSGVKNSASGYGALYSNTEGDENTAGGHGALYGNTTGAQNTAQGYGALAANITGTFNTAVGYMADAASSALTNATAIGANAIVDASNKVRIGDSNVTVIEGEVDFSFTSDRNKKENFLDVDGEEVLNEISKFALQSWNYKHDPDKIRHYGPVSQDFYRAFGHDALGTIGSETTLCGSDVNGINMIAIQALVKENKEQSQEIDELKSIIAHMNEKIERMESR